MRAEIPHICSPGVRDVPTTCRAALLLIPLVLLALAAVTPRAAACPFCDGGPDGVNEVRDGIFDENFWPRVAATVAPFPVLAGLSP